MASQNHFAATFLASSPFFLFGLVDGLPGLPMTVPVPMAKKGVDVINSRWGTLEVTRVLQMFCLIQ